MPEYDEVLSMWGPDIAPVTPQTALYHFSLAVLGFIGFGAFIKYALVPDQIAVRREYPFSGLVTELGGLEENKVRSYLLGRYLHMCSCTHQARETDIEDTE